MKDISHLFEQVYLPIKSFVVSQRLDDSTRFRIETYDFDSIGRPVNATSLSLTEAVELAGYLDVAGEVNRGFLTPVTLLPENVLYLSASGQGKVIWYTPPALQQLFFLPELAVASGPCHVPGMIWMGDPDQLRVYAYIKKGKPVLDTPLYHAPFLNVHENGLVCMGDVELQVSNKSLNAFMDSWQRAFWDSFFSHTINDFVPIIGDFAALWNSLSGTGIPFPAARLIKAGKTTLKNLL